MIRNLIDPEDHMGLARKMAQGVARDADDVVNDCMLALLQKRRLYDPSRGAQSNFAWHVFRGAIVSPQRRKKLPESSGWDEQGESDPNLSSVDHRDLLAELGKSLTDTEKRVVYLRVVMTLGFQEIGDEMGMSKGWVYTTFERAMRLLKAEARRMGDVY